MEHLIPLILNLVGGAIGGGLAGRAKSIDMGGLVNAAAGVIGGGALGHVLQSASPMLRSAAFTDIAGLIGNFVTGGVGGAIVAAILGLIINRLRPGD